VRFVLLLLLQHQFFLAQTQRRDFPLNHNVLRDRQPEPEGLHQ
jgi:hypothetical protein